MVVSSVGGRFLVTFSKLNPHATHEITNEIDGEAWANL